MSRLYSGLQDQLQNILFVIMQDENGQVQWGQYITGPVAIRYVISILAVILYAILFFAIGIYLWNQGLSAVAPSVIMPIGDFNVAQADNPYYQLFITLLAIMMFS